MTKVHIYPSFSGEDKGDGGIRRVVEAQVKHLPVCGIELVEDPAEADVIAAHARIAPQYPKLYPDTPIVGMIHGLYWSEYDWGNWALKANQDVMELIRIADAITAPTNWVANAINRNACRPAVVIPHGVEFDEWANFERSTSPNAVDYVLWNKTRPDPVCDPTPLNEVAKLMPNTPFVSTFGDESANVTLTGRVGYDEARRLVQHAALYLATSRETFGIGTLEAAAAGVPIVGYKWAGQKEIFADGRGAFLVKPNDSQALAYAIEQALIPDIRKRLSKEAQEVAREYTWEAACQQYADLFRELHAKKLAERQAPRVSIIVTNYNLHKYLPACLESVAAQDDTSFECIVVDDSSTEPEGREIANEWASKDERFRSVGTMTNQYLADARNTGIYHARGKYILPLDADDMLTPAAVRLLANALDEERGIHVSYGNVSFIEEDGELVMFDGNGVAGRSGWPVPFTFEQQMMQRNLLPYSSMFRRSAWEATAGYRPRCRTAEDADMWSRLSSYGFRPRMVTEEATLVYRIRGDSMSHEQPATNWVTWFPWSRRPELTPAGATTRQQAPVPSYDPILVSVVIPVGPGHGKLLMDALDSVEAQTFQNWECIVVNDTGYPLRNLPPWVKTYSTPEPRSGAAAARNIGVSHASAPIYLPLDADDYLQPSALEAMVSLYMKTRDIIYADFWEDPRREGHFEKLELPDANPIDVLPKHCMHAVTALTPVAIWREVGGYDENMKSWEDWDFQLKCADAGYCSRRIGFPLWTYRKHTGYRREDAYANLDGSKAEMMERWGALWNGGKKLGCSSCSGRPTLYPVSTGNYGTMSSMASQPALDGDTVRVQYIGTKAGGVNYRGKSGTVYTFAAGDAARYVLESDAQMFINRPNEFTVLSSESIEDPGSEPMLVAPGAP